MSEPWKNFGLLCGDDEPTDDNVIPMPEAVFHALPEDTWRPDRAFDELPQPICQLAWDVLGHDGHAPKMRLVVSTRAVEEAVERVIEQIPVVVRVQSRLDSYKTDKQRKQRLKELEELTRANDGYASVEETIERYALWGRFRQHRNVTAKEIEDVIYNGAIGGTLPLTVNIDGRRLTVPQEVVRRSIRH